LWKIDAIKSGAKLATTGLRQIQSRIPVEGEGLGLSAEAKKTVRKRVAAPAAG
jgi:hypothetical protein